MLLYKYYAFGKKPNQLEMTDRPLVNKTVTVYVKAEFVVCICYLGQQNQVEKLYFCDHMFTIKWPKKAGALGKSF